MSLTLHLNGNARLFPELHGGSTLAQLVQELALKSDRVAVELNGEIVPRAGWHDAVLKEGDRLEVVHFVGGGSFAAAENAEPVDR